MSYLVAPQVAGGPSVSNTPPWEPQPPSATRPTAAPNPTAPGPIVGGGGGELTSQQQDAVAYLQSLLDYYELGSLSGWAYDQVVAGNSPEMILQMLRQTPEYKQRFRVIEERRRLGLAPMSEAEVIAYEKNARQLMRAAGLPPGFYDQRTDFDSFMVGDVSLSELSDRIEEARVWAYQTDAQTRAEMDRLYGAGTSAAFSPEDSVAMFLDPNRALPLIQRRVAAARLSSTGVRSGFGGLTLAEAERFYELGIDPGEALRGFGALVAGRELFGDLPGGIDEGQISRAEQLGLIEGDERSRQRIEQRARARRAPFAGGGGFAASREGFSGLGSAQ